MRARYENDLSQSRLKVGVTSDFHRAVDVNCALLGCYMASSVSSLRMLRATYGYHLQGSRIWILDRWRYYLYV